jgi:glycosyltransferase involved in cell wall biosynthesis
VKVAFVTASPSIWGAETSLLILLRFLKLNKVDTTTIVDIDSPFARVLEDNGHHSIRHNFAKHTSLGSGSASSARFSDVAREVPAIYSSAKQLCGHLAEVDVVVAFSVWQSFETLLAAAIANKPTVFDLHETFSGSRATAVLSIIARISRLTLAPSMAVLDRSGIPEKRAVVIPRPVNFPSENLERTNDPGSSGLKIGLFGQIAPHKGVKELINALGYSSEIAQRQISVLIVGGNPDVHGRTKYENEVRSLAQEFKTAQIDVVDRTPDVHKLMAECDIVMNLSEHEAFGRTVVEAISNGSYPVVLDNGGPAEIVRETGIGEVLPDFDTLPAFLSSLSGRKLEDIRGDRGARVSAVRDRYSPNRVSRLYSGELTRVAAAKRLEPKQFVRPGIARIILRRIR